MSPLFYVVFASILATALLVIAVVYALDLGDQRRAAGAFRASRKQRRAWAKERADLNPAMRGRW